MINIKYMIILAMGPIVSYLKLIKQILMLKKKKIVYQIVKNPLKVLKVKVVKNSNLQ